MISSSFSWTLSQVFFTSSQTLPLPAGDDEPRRSIDFWLPWRRRERACVVAGHVPLHHYGWGGDRGYRTRASFPSPSLLAAYECPILLNLAWGWIPMPAREKNSALSGRTWYFWRIQIPIRSEKNRFWKFVKKKMGGKRWARTNAAYNPSPGAMQT